LSLFFWDGVLGDSVTPLNLLPLKNFGGKFSDKIWAIALVIYYHLLGHCPNFVPHGLMGYFRRLLLVILKFIPKGRIQVCGGVVLS